MKIEFDILTLFPEMVEGFSSSSMLARAQSNEIIGSIHIILEIGLKISIKPLMIYPYGGGAGMVMSPAPIFNAIESLKQKHSKVIYMAPRWNTP